MSRITKYFSFRTQIIALVILIAITPLILFGFYSLTIADKSQKEFNDIKDMLLSNISLEVENFFIKYNKSLSFTRTIEKRKITDKVTLSKILLEALQSNKELLVIGYVQNNRIITLFGDDITNPTPDESVALLLNNYTKNKWIQISEAYPYITDNSYAFNILYPLDMIYPVKTDDFIFATFSLKELINKFNANSIGKTGKFALVKDDGSMYIGDDLLKYRFTRIEIDKILKDNTEDTFTIKKKGYQIKGYKVRYVLWPFWIIFTQNMYETNALIHKLKFSILIALTVLLFVSAAISFSLSNNFSRPISGLLKAVIANSTKGTLESKATLNKKDSNEMKLLINEFNNMIDNLKETRKQLLSKEKLSVVGEMANIMCHDIRNPLSSIKTGVFYLKKVLTSTSQMEAETLVTMDREINNINKIIANLLGFSRMKPPSLEPVDLNHLIKEVISILDIPDNVKIETTENEIPVYNIDRGELRQVLVNLINNAVQACNKDKGIVNVITTKEDNENLNITIKDNGMGIPQDKIDKIFEAFYSTKAGGTGLGLASAKRIVERHNGTLKILSKDKIGTEVIISIPHITQNDLNSNS